MRTVSDCAVASTQGQIRISTFKYGKYYKTNPRPFLWDKLWFISKYLPKIQIEARQYNQIKEQFKYGDIVPAIVIDKHSSLIGAFTSLGSREGVLAPALKIVKEKLDLIDNYPEIKNGHKFAAVALYSASKESLNNSCWSDFHPIVVDCLAKEKIDCRIALKRIKPLAWECLDMSLQSMKKNRIPGLYHVELPSSIVSGTF